MRKIISDVYISDEICMLFSDAESDVNATKWFMRAGMDKSLSLKESAIGLKGKRSATAVPSKTNSEVLFAPPTKLARKPDSQMKSGSDFDQLPMVESLNKIQEAVDSYLTGKNIDQHNSSTSIAENVLKTDNDHEFPQNSSSDPSLLHSDLTMNNLPPTSHISSISQGTCIYQRQENNGSTNSDVGYFANKKCRSPNSIQNPQDESNYVTDSDTLPVDSIKIEPIDSEFTSTENDCSDLPLCSDNNRSMTFVPNVSGDGDDPNNMDSQATQIFTQSDGTACMFITKPEDISLEENRANGMYDCDENSLYFHYRYIVLLPVFCMHCQIIRITTCRI